MERICMIALLTLAVVGGAFAQNERMVVRHPGPDGAGGPIGPGPHAPLGKWWKNSDVVKELQLTDPQIKQIEQTFLDYRLKLIDLRADVERQETKLQPLIEADRPDEQQVSNQVDAVLSARAKLEKTNTMMMLAIRKSLSVEQWTKLQAIQEKREKVFFWHFEGPTGRGVRTERDVFFNRGPDGHDSGPLPPHGPGENE